MARFRVRTDGLSFGGVDDQGVSWMTQTVDGWGTAGSTYSPVQRTRRSGAVSGYAYAKSRQVAVSGLLQAPTSQAADDALDRLASEIRLDEFPLYISAGGAERWISAKRSDAVTILWVNDTDVSWSFQVGSDDWRKFGDDLTASTLLPSSTGGLTVPFTIPFTINASQVTGQVSLTNPGNETGPVRLRVDGPCTGPVITHVGSGRALVFSSTLVLGVGEWIDIDMDAQTVLANGQSSRAGYITSRGWFGFEPGPNTFSFTAQGYDPVSKLTVTATPAWQ